ncbi:hypothetical protein BDV96DRAFT_606371 [Lophiotrema nucula]|uniref:Uncharacterized protein n=1 Tax=Lophiotrema nucula TaxID=690887 RepID=A0A6A5YJT8_9PLEO|nr:hypothetical protein BDV96DRAFT_606371 [Lophiotrema nucula]
MVMRTLEASDIAALVTMSGCALASYSLLPKKKCKDPPTKNNTVVYLLQLHYRIDGRGRIWDAAAALVNDNGESLNRIIDFEGHHKGRSLSSRLRERTRPIDSLLDTEAFLVAFARPPTDGGSKFRDRRHLSCSLFTCRLVPFVLVIINVPSLENPGSISLENGHHDLSDNTVYGESDLGSWNAKGPHASLARSVDDGLMLS